MDNLKQIAYQIKDRRKALKISIDRLADQAGVHRLTVMNLEKGRVSTVETVSKVIAALDGELFIQWESD